MPTNRTKDSFSKTTKFDQLQIQAQKGLADSSGKTRIPGYKGKRGAQKEKNIRYKTH